MTDAGFSTTAACDAGERVLPGTIDQPHARLVLGGALAGTHPDLTWVRPTGAHVMRVDDVDEPVVAAAGRTPFESSRRMFVLERVETMNDEVANRLLKTLEEPPPFVHLILLTESLGQVLETYSRLMSDDPGRWRRIDATRSPEEIHAEVLAEVEAVRSGARA